MAARPRRPLDLWRTLDLLDAATCCLNEFRGSVADLLEDLQTGGTGLIAADFERNADNTYRTLWRLKELAAQANDAFSLARSKDPVFLRPFEKFEVERFRNREEQQQHFGADDGGPAAVTVAESAVDALGTMAEILFDFPEASAVCPPLSFVGARRLFAKAEAEVDLRRSGQGTAELQNWADAFVDAWAKRNNSSRSRLQVLRLTAAPVIRLRLRVARAFNAELLLIPSGPGATVAIARVCLFALDEECNLWMQSKHGLFRMLSDWAGEAADHFGRRPSRKRVMLRGPAATASPPEGMTDDDEEKFLEVNGAWEFMEWLELYHDLFTAPCCGCGRLIKRQGLNAEFILPHVRVFTGLPGYDQKNPRSFGKAWHRSCLS